MVEAEQGRKLGPTLPPPSPNTTTFIQSIGNHIMPLPPLPSPTFAHINSPWRLCRSPVLWTHTPPPPWDGMRATTMAEVVREFLCRPSKVHPVLGLELIRTCCELQNRGASNKEILMLQFTQLFLLGIREVERVLKDLLQFILQGGEGVKIGDNHILIKMSF